jgi:hypothetical protein
MTQEEIAGTSRFDFSAASGSIDPGSYADGRHGRYARAVDAARYPNRKPA